MHIIHIYTFRYTSISHTYIYMHTYTYVNTCIKIQTMHTQILRHTNISHTYTYINMQAYTHMHTYMHITHTYTHSGTHAYHTHAHIHICKHTYINLPPCVLAVPLPEAPGRVRTRSANWRTEKVPENLTYTQQISACHMHMGLVIFTAGLILVLIAHFKSRWQWL